MANITKAERERRAAAAEASTPDLSETHVTMVRDAEQYPEPHRAIVHLGEVDNYRVGGWEIDEC